MPLYGVNRATDPATPPLCVMLPPFGPLRIKELLPPKVVSLKANVAIVIGKAKTSQQIINPNKPRLLYTITRLLPPPKSGGTLMRWDP